MYKSTAVNVLTIIAAVFLAISLAFLGTTTVGVCVASSIFTPDTIVEMFQAGDYTEIMPAEIFLDGMDSEYEVEDEFIDAMIDSKAFEEIVSQMSSGMIDALTGEGGDEIIEARDIKKAIKDNIDELVEIIDDNVKSDYSKREIEDMILEEVDVIAEEIAYNAPTADELADEMDPTAQSIFAFVSSGSLSLIFIVVTVILAACVYLLRFKYLRGFIWVGSSGLAVSLFTLLSGVSMDLIVSIMAADAMYESDALIVNSFVDIIAGKFVTAGLLVGAVSIVLLLVGIIVGNKLKKNSKAKAAAAAVPAV